MRPTSSTATGRELDFNPRTPVGCDRRGCLYLRRRQHFNPRTPVGCDWAHISSVLRITNFNPRTPVGCDFVRVDVGFRNPVISIHAPQWGATYVTAEILYGSDISIHAPQWGATGIPHVAHRFQHVISIHAPQWGATSARSPPSCAPSDFNPRTPVGCDRTCSQHQPQIRRFQSTHPSGVRPAPVRRCAGRPDFNPRTPVGCDIAALVTLAVSSKFQSTHPSGVRPAMLP